MSGLFGRRQRALDHEPEVAKLIGLEVVNIDPTNSSTEMP